jgi:uncharacterized surface protein with fasciclin (FAS1) repeats
MKFTSSSVFKAVALLSVSSSVFQVNATGDSCKTIAEIACGTEGFETLCALVKEAGLAPALSEGEFTVFAPTDDAFAELPAEVTSYLLSDKDALTNVLLFHAIGEEVFSKDLSCTPPGKNLVEMLNGKDARVLCVDGGIFIKGGGNPRSDMPEIVTVDIEACNGVVHVIDKVMVPGNFKLPDSEEEPPETPEEPAECQTIGT